MNQTDTGAGQRVPALYMSSECQHPAFEVVDALDNLQGRLGAFRAVAQLADSERHADDGLPQVRRGDLAQLILVLSSDLELHVSQVRGIALEMVRGSAQGANPV